MPETPAVPPPPHPAADVSMVTEATATAETGERLSIRERLAYGIGDLGGNLIFVPITTFLLFYLTDVAGVGAAIAGTILLLGRVMDGTLDLIIGTLIDKTSTRWGKARPWLLFSAPFVAITFVLLFNIPSGFSDTGKEIYAFVFYFLCLGVGYVSSNLAYHTLLSVITTSGRMRVSLTVIRTACALVASLAVSILTIPIVGAFGGGQGGWTLTTLIYGAIALITLLVVFFGTKERVRPAKSETPSQKRPVRELIKLLFKNRFFLLGFAFFLSVYLLSGSTGSGVYFAQDVLGDATLYSLLSFAQLGPIIVGIWFMPRVIARFGKRKPILIGIVITLVGALVTLIDPSNVTVVLVGVLLKSIGGIPALSSMYALIADIVDYGEWKTGVRVDGMTYGAATAGQNFGAGIGAALVGWLLAAGNYEAGAVTQAPSAIGMEIFLFLGLPIVIALVQAVVMLFLNVDKYIPQIQKDLALRRGVATD